MLAGWNRDYRRFRYDAESRSFINETLSSPAQYPEYGDLAVEELMVAHRMALLCLYRSSIKDLLKNGSNPVLLYSYGAYGRSMTPFFSPSMLLWTWKGGILAVPHVRGGGELGDKWHTSGMKTTKANTWKDAISAAEFLVKTDTPHPATSPSMVPVPAEYWSVGP